MQALVVPTRMVTCSKRQPSVSKHQGWKIVIVFRKQSLLLILLTGHLNLSWGNSGTIHWSYGAGVQQSVYLQHNLPTLVGQRSVRWYLPGQWPHCFLARSRIPPTLANMDESELQGMRSVVRCPSHNYFVSYT
jgi:hypothetical protein